MATGSQRRIIRTSKAGTTAENARQTGPHGVGMGVAFDWSLAMQLLIMAPFLIAGSGPGAAVAQMSRTARIGLGSAAAAVAPVALGESVRRGNRYGWLLQIAFNSLLPISGLLAIPDTISTLRHGHFGDLVRTFVLLIISPLIVAQLTRLASRAWFGHVASAEAQARHGGWWIAGIVAWSIAGGAAIAFAPLY